MFINILSYRFGILFLMTIIDEKLFEIKKQTDRHIFIPRAAFTAGSHKLQDKHKLTEESFKMPYNKYNTSV